MTALQQQLASYRERMTGSNRCAIANGCSRYRLVSVVRPRSGERRLTLSKAVMWREGPELRQQHVERAPAVVNLAGSTFSLQERPQTCHLNSLLGATGQRRAGAAGPAI